jgi:D-alanine-D-alanine ligase
MKKLRVGLVYGGRSGEHEVSIRSAESIRNNLDKKKYQVVDIKIDKKGKWDIAILKRVDVVFPVVHGTFGEDGCLQGLLEMMDKAYVGAGVLGSAVGMDKEVMKRLFCQANIPTAKFETAKKWEVSDVLLRMIAGELKYPLFIKPANLGSSVGISKAHNMNELKTAVVEAGKYDTKILFEEAIEGREIECAVLGNRKPEASMPGEIKPTHEFYDYEAKYVDENGATLEIPAKLTKNQIKEVQEMAIRAYRALDCEGMARVDMFLKSSGKIVVNEANTLPGFTNISMYPKLWEESGLTYGKLLDRLISLAIERKQERDELVRSYQK